MRTVYVARSWWPRSSATGPRTSTWSSTSWTASRRRTVRSGRTTATQLLPNPSEDKMAAKITRRVVRETDTLDPNYHETLMVSLEPGGKFMLIWQKGRRKKFKITYESVWSRAYQEAAHSA